MVGKKKSSVYIVIKSSKGVHLPLSWKKYDFTEVFSSMEEGVQLLMLQGYASHSVGARPRKDYVLHSLS